MRKPLRWLLSFSGIVWTISIALVLYLTLSPLVQNFWAAAYWQVTPCTIGEKGYTYTFDGKRHHATRKDFWERRESRDAAIDGLADPEPNASCYVNPSHPDESVLNVDAHKHLSRGFDRLIVDVLILAVAFGVTRKIRRPNPPSAQREPTV